jgi:hypothetical protein
MTTPLLKYEFTGETKTAPNGATLHRIRALVAFGSIAAGTLGGWIESEANLAQVSGNAWVYGDAQVSGDAWVSGNARVYGDAQVYGNAHVSGDAWVCVDASKTPIVVSGLAWTVTITDRHMRIGCQYHLLEDWQAFDDRRIAAMDEGGAARFWRDHKATLFALVKATGRPFAVEVSK